MTKKYNPKYNDIVFELKLSGKTNEEIYKLLDISEKTFYRWMKQYKCFNAAYTKARTAVKKAKETLIDKANGFTKQVEKVTASGRVVKCDEYFPPDFQALKYLLRNASEFDKELEHKIQMDKEKLELDKFEKWLEKNELTVLEKMRKIYEAENKETDK